jgi:hypothetical protein
MSELTKQEFYARLEAYARGRRVGMRIGTTIGFFMGAFLAAAILVFSGCQAPDYRAVVSGAGDAAYQGELADTGISTYLGQQPLEFFCQVHGVVYTGFTDGEKVWCEDCWVIEEFKDVDPMIEIKDNGGKK